jgi:serine protease Do
MMKFYLGRATLSASLILMLAPGSLAVRGEEPSPALALAQQLNQAFIEIAERVSISVVVIEVTQKSQGRHPLFDMLSPEDRRRLEDLFEQESQRRRPSTGSGVVIRPDGYILTNSHVVEHAEEIKVRFRDGRVYNASVRGVDPLSDIAVLKIEADGLPAAKLGDSDKTRVGEFAIAIGAPLDLDYSVTFGHVSAKGRTGLIGGELGTRMDQDFIQTDASINPGNSGGPLVNIYGEVIGINTLIRGLNTGIGFAVPVNLARNVSEQLIEAGRFSRAWIGIGVTPLRGHVQFQALKNLPVQEGLVVEGFPPGGPAAKSALKPFDIITRVDGTSVSNALELRNAVRAKPAGSTILLEVFRVFPQEQKLEIEITTGEMTDAGPRVAATGPEPRREKARTAFGFTVENLTKDLAEQHNLSVESEGVIVTSVDSESVAERHGIKVGDLIVEVNNEAVKRPEDFHAALQGMESVPVLLGLIRNGARTYKILRDER